MEEFIDKILDKCTVEDLMNGYVYDQHYRVYTCIFCGEIFDEDLIYKHEDQLCTARRSIKIHIQEKHESPFAFLLEMNRKYTSITERQKEIFEFFYNESDTRVIAEKMETTPATVRSYRFKMREKLIQSKVYMAIISLIDEKNSEDTELGNESIRDLAIYEKLKMAEKSINEVENDEDLKNLINEKYKGRDLNFMNLFIDKGSPDIED